MRITDIELVELEGPELAEPVRPAWAPGSEWRRWRGTVARVHTDEGIVGLGSPGYVLAPVVEADDLDLVAGQVAEQTVGVAARHDHHARLERDRPVE